MSAVITANNRASRDTRAPAPATHEDGRNYQWRMFYDGGRTIADADHLFELIECLLPDYAHLETSEQRLGARMSIAKGVQMQARAQILANITEEDKLGLEDWEIAVLEWNGDDTIDPYGWGDGTGELGTKHPANEWVPDIWSSDVPLVLVSTSYGNSTGIPRPISSHGDAYEVPNIVWLRPETEHALLTSLSRIGYIAFGEPDSTPRG